MTMSKRRWMTPDDWTDEDIASLPAAIRLTWLGLKMFADDQGRESATAARLRAALYPLDEAVTDDTIDRHLLELEATGHLVLYVVGPRTYYAITEWPRVDQPKPSRIPAPPAPIQTASGDRLESLAVVGERREGGETEEESEERRAREDTSGASLEPSPFCSQHPDGTENRCGGCGTARKRHDLWARGIRSTSARPSFEEA